ncbi:hypothetical protein ACOSQ2_000279 [Xanthoceras sorbifolium]
MDGNLCMGRKKKREKKRKRENGRAGERSASGACQGHTAQPSNLLFLAKTGMYGKKMIEALSLSLSLGFAINGKKMMGKSYLGVVWYFQIQ